MAVKVAINGFGRIGRLALRLMVQNPEFDVVAINDLTDAHMLAHLFKYDSAQGRFNGTIEVKENAFLVNGKEIKVFAQADPANLPWGELGVDVVLECTGFFTKKEKAEAHIQAGAKKVVISAPATGDLKTIVYNVNDNILDGTETVISGASCTTNCLAPMAKALQDNFGIVEGLMTTIHAYTNDQNTLDAVNDVDIEKITYGFGENCDYRAENISADKGVHEQFDIYYKGELLTNIKLIVPGKHNIYNALAAAATAHYLGATPKEIAKNLHKFGGVHRRFEILGTPEGITVADDFAHHPTELTATLNAAMNMGFKKVWAIFQPHTFSRTALLLDDFAEALKIPDVAIISEILPVRETNTYNIYSTDLGAKVPNSVCLDTFEEITDYVCKNAKEGDLILTMGGGNVYMCANMIYNQLKYNEENK